jgi:hypothetical protein
MATFVSTELLSINVINIVLTAEFDEEPEHSVGIKRRKNNGTKSATSKSDTLPATTAAEANTHAHGDTPLTIDEEIVPVPESDAPPGNTAEE